MNKYYFNLCCFVLLLSFGTLQADCVDILDDFESNRLMSYNNSDGGLNENFTNPGVNYVNSSTKCARYARTAALYDNIFCSFSMNGDYFRSGIRVFKMDVYSPAAGLDVDITLANSAVAGNQPYPAGRHSIYRATTTMANAWETLSFVFINTPDIETNGVVLDQLLIAFSPNSAVARVFYFDNITVTGTHTILNLDGEYNGLIGGYDGSALDFITNPFPENEINSSFNCVRYSRSTIAYDLIVINPTSLGNGDDFKGGARQFKLNIYSKGPGTLVAITIVNAQQAYTNPYPSGRHSIYEATTTKTNQWETLTFSFAVAPDQGLAGNTCDQLFLQINPGSTAAAQWDFDDLLISPVPVAGAPTPISGATTACRNQTGVVYSVTSVAGSTFTWSLPTGATIASGANSNSITVNYGASAASGTIAVRVNSAGGCASAWTTKGVTVNAGGTVSAGADKSVCPNDVSVSLNGTVSGTATVGSWIASGNGDFIPGSTSLNTQYMITTADQELGQIEFVLTANVPGCGTITDYMLVSLVAAVVDAGDPSEMICTNIPSFWLNGSVMGTSTVDTWTTSGTGTFTPNANTANAFYVPSPADKENGAVTLTLTAIAGSCPAVSDSKYVQFVVAPTVSAGPDQSFCSAVTTVSLSGTITGNPLNPTWTTAGTGTFSSTTDLNAIYTPSTSDKTNGVTLTLSAEAGYCGTPTDVVSLSFGGAAIVNAGADRDICNDVSNVMLSASVSGASGGAWTTAGTGDFIPNNTSFTTYYIPSAADRTGALTFTYSTNGVGCAAASDATVVNFVVCTSTKDALSNTAISIYPNPASNGEFSVEGIEVHELTVVNAWGQQEQFFSSKIRTSMKGVLTLIIKTTSEEIYTSKIVVY